jgi:hypothetical protein
MAKRRRPPGGGMGGGGEGGRGNAQPRGPDFFFDIFSGGKDSFDVNTAPIPERMSRGGESADQKRELWRVFLQKKGVTDGQMTRELFREYFMERVRRGGGRGDEEQE